MTDRKRVTASALAGANRHRPAGLDVERVAQEAARARRSPTVAGLLAAPAPDADPTPDPLELTDAEAAIADERAARARRTRTVDPVDAVLDGTPPGPTHP